MSEIVVFALIGVVFVLFLVVEALRQRDYSNRMAENAQEMAAKLLSMYNYFGSKYDLELAAEFVRLSNEWKARPPYLS
jgi:hypothetical protein